MHRLAALAIAAAVAATLLARRWVIEKPVQWAGPLTGGAR